MIFIRWYADRHMTMWQSLWDDCHMRRWQCVYEANTSLSLVILQTTMHSLLPLETFCLTGPTITKVCNRVPLGGFKWPWDLVIWWLCWSQSVETPLVLKYIPTRPSLCRVWIRAVAGLEEQSFVRNCSSVGRAGRGQPSSSRCSNCDSEKSFAFEGVWRHTCLSVDFVSGRLLLVENGLLLKETVSEELTNIFKVGTFICSLQTWERLIQKSNFTCIILRQILIIMIIIFIEISRRHLMGQWTALQWDATTARQHPHHLLTWICRYTKCTLTRKRTCIFISI